MSALTAVLEFFDGLLGSAAYFPILLLGVGVFFTLYLGFPQLRFFRHAWAVLFGRFSKSEDPGDTSHFQALSTALSGTVGTGNIGGVAFAIFLGGPAALFWMWATAFVGMTTKFVEVSISHKYRKEDDQGFMVGGPMHYMEHGLKLKWLAVFFAVATVISSFGSGNMPQANNMAAGIETSFAIPSYLTGGILALLLGFVIIGGIKRIAAVASTLVPLMGTLYALGAIAVLITHYDNVVPSFIAVFENAFTGSAAAGGFLGASFAYAFNRGVNRGLYSNEAGQGSAPIAHASARTKEPVAEGMVSILEPFIDTLIICTLTGLVILSSGVWKEKFENDFSTFDTEIVMGQYDEKNSAHVRQLAAHLDLVPPANDPVRPYSGVLDVVNGQLDLTNITVLHNRSIAEDVQVARNGKAVNGAIRVQEGSVVEAGVTLSGKSLLHSVPLTARAFSSSFLGSYGEYLVTIGLVLFAFSTALAWSYYGDRAVVYLVGTRWVMPYRLLYIGGFFVATIADTSLIWLISAITVALMTLPNLIGILMMRKEVKQMTQTYWQKIKAD
ncbi:MAG TPA: sodium:alanine symporter family protein [Gammaproteobacteria bacterium]|nr:sodium:alanine symporter family protein [Gammaproteobacteria bacterium]